MDRLDNEADKKLICDMYERFAKNALYVARMSVGNKPDAEDIVNGVFLRMIGHVQTLRDYNDKQRYGYLIKAIENKCFRDHRHDLVVEKHEFLASDAELAEIIDVDGDVALLIEKREDIRMLGEYIASLREIDRQVLFMRYLYDMNYQEMGDIMGSTKENMRVYTWRIIRKLKEMGSQRGGILDGRD